VQETVTEPPPTADELTVPTLAYTLPVFTPDTLTDAGVLALQVSGTPVSVIPKVSFTVAFNTVDVPLGTVNKVLEELLAGVTEID
jgi:hypothetical protein